MMRKLPLIFLVLALSILHVFVLDKTDKATGGLAKGENVAFMLPAQIIKITTLEFDGLVSDFLFLKATTFIGSTYERKERPRVKEWEWRWLYTVLAASAGLDPFFFDPYYVANAHLTWQAGLVRETNSLLEQGSRSRDWDWRPPFYIGFNKFFFLHEDSQASVFLMEASRRPGGSPTLVSLASKLAYKEGRTESAILFLQEVVEKTEDTQLKEYYEKRLETLQGIYLLEKAIGKYRERFRRPPGNPDDLIIKGIISKIPKEPFGGMYYFDADGRVKTTNENELMPILKKRR